MKELVQGRVKSELDSLAIFDHELKRLQRNIDSNSSILTELKAKGSTSKDESVRKIVDEIIQDSFKLAPLYQDYVAKLDVLCEYKILTGILEIDLGLEKEDQEIFNEVTQKSRMYAVQGNQIVIADKETYDLHSAGLAEKLRSLDYEQFFNSKRFEKLPTN